MNSSRKSRSQSNLRNVSYLHVDVEALENWVGLLEFDMDSPQCCLDTQPILPNTNLPIGQNMENPKFKSTQPRAPTKWDILHEP